MTGTEDRWTSDREDMVERQLRRRGIHDERVLAAMLQVPRHEFIPWEQRGYAYADGPLPIGSGQTISQPYMVAFTLQAASVSPTDRVLDVGTGSGYAAAVAALVAQEVYSMDRLGGLADEARTRLERLGFANVTVDVGDASVGWPEHAPYDAIVSAAAAPRIPDSWKRQLAPGGRIVTPVGSRWDQELVCGSWEGETFRTRRLLGVRYVPLIGEEGF
jgi:protein-L-isoaspartate(D-aspartate) O-methyltransferase